MTTSSFFHQKVIVITGASSGIGAALSRELSQFGVRMTLAARSVEKLRALANEIQGPLCRVMVCPTDVSQPDQVQGMIDKTLQEFGRIDLLVNNAGRGQFGRLEECSIKEMKEIMEVNYWGAVFACRGVIPVMKRQGEGMIVNVTSTVAFHGQPELAAYSDSKAALHSLTEGLRIELSPYNISVVEIQPGVIRNDFHWNAAGRGDHPYKLRMIRGATTEILARKMLPAIAARQREWVFPRFWYLYKGFNRIFPSIVEWAEIRFLLPKLSKH